MLSKFFKKVPADTIVVPMILASMLNTIMPNLLRIRPMSEAITSKEGLNAIINITLVAVGSQLTIKRLRLAIHRGLVLLLSKWLTAIVLGFIFFTSLSLTSSWMYTYVFMFNFNWFVSLTSVKLVNDGVFVTVFINTLYQKKTRMFSFLVFSYIGTFATAPFLYSMLFNFDLSFYRCFSRSLVSLLPLFLQLMFPCLIVY